MNAPAEKTNAHTFFLTDAQINFLRIHAETQDITPSDIIRQLVDDCITRLQSQIIEPDKVEKLAEGLVRFVFDFRAGAFSGIVVVAGPPKVYDMVSQEKSFSLQTTGMHLSFDPTAIDEFHIRKEN